MFTELEALKRYLVLEAGHLASMLTVVFSKDAAAIWLATILCQMSW
jgi:hypothetical protein